ncbi:kinase-like protein [Rhizophagus irregularis]|uniref:Kinase-like protein n=1 Tax=Rhizophagus irregularis TaxID=588596 RepID=A0A2N0Q6K5_9GLOM|nr:kinase-like protein [Rhizophagus irregularis]
MSLPSEIARKIYAYVKSIVVKKEEIHEEKMAIEEDEKHLETMKKAVNELRLKINRQKERIHVVSEEIKGIENNISGQLQSLKEIKEEHEKGMVSPKYRYVEQENAATVYERVELESFLKSQKIRIFDSQIFKNPTEIGSGGFSFVYVAYWKNTTAKYAIKKFKETSKEGDIINKILYYERIVYILFILDEKKYSLVLEYADGGTLRDHLRNNIIVWKNQLRFAKEITSAILWLHDDEGIIHGDLHPNNILIHQNTIKLADFGRSSEKGSDCYNTEEVWGVMPYVDPKLTSCTPPFDGLDDDEQIICKILSGGREEPVLDTNVKFIELYQKCWEYEPDERPNISQVNSELNSIDSENNNASTVPYSKESEENFSLSS